MGIPRNPVLLRSFVTAVGAASLLVVLGLASAHAGPIEDRLGNLLQDLPADRIPSGILYDRVLPLSHIDNHDGTPQSRPASLDEWRQMYSEIYRASLTRPAWPSLDAVISGSREAEQRGIVPLAVMSFRYDRIRSDAITNGLLQNRGGRLELAPPPSGNPSAAPSPFVSRRVFALAALRDHTYRGGKVTFRIDRAWYYTNDPSAPASLQADFDDGAGFASISFGADRIVHYVSDGSKTLRLRAILTDGDTLNAAATFQVEQLTTPLPNDTLHITASIPYDGSYGTGDAYVYLAPIHQQITEPMVVLEGFDLENTMDWDQLYALLNQQNLLENLRSLGFDAVVLKYTDATTYVERNAFVAVELIQQVRNIIGAGHDMALIGASMGGVVGRYALDYMENQGLPTAVRSFISFDGPQEGADIPLGLQYWVWFFAGESSDAAQWLAALDTPAARQLLVYHHTDPPGTTGQPDPLRGTMASELAALGGYPTGLRLVSIANGSGDQVNQGFNAGAELIKWEYDNFLINLVGDVWAVPDGNNQTIFHGRLNVLFQPPDEVYVNAAGTAPYDGAPGGWRDTMAQVDSVVAPVGDIVALYPNHCFIPTISSLDVNTTDLFYNIAGDPNLLAHVPFDAVYYPATNEEHVEIDAQNAPWLMAEVERGATGVAPRAPAPFAAAIEPARPNPFDGSTQVRFTVPAAGPARLAVFDATGRQAAVLADRTFPAGVSELAWDGTGATGARLAPGVYFLRLRGPGYTAVQKVTLR